MAPLPDGRAVRVLQPGRGRPSFLSCWFEEIKKMLCSCVREARRSKMTVRTGQSLRTDPVSRRQTRTAHGRRSDGAWPSDSRSPRCLWEAPGEEPRSNRRVWPGCAGDAGRGQAELTAGEWSGPCLESGVSKLMTATSCELGLWGGEGSPARRWGSLTAPRGPRPWTAD